VTIEDAESGEQLFVDTNDPSFRQRFACAGGTTRSRLARALGKAQVDTLELATTTTCSNRCCVSWRCAASARGNAAARTCRRT